MRYLRCKCGNRESWSTMGVPRCEGCGECGTTLDESESGHTAPADHFWAGPHWEFDRDTGAKWRERRCIRCGLSEPVDEIAHAERLKSKGAAA